MNRAELAQSLWTDARADAHLLGRLRAAYRGRHDVLDALWWCAHPLTPTPDGRPDPAGELAPLSERVYSRPAGSDSPAHPKSEPLVEFVDPLSHHTVRATVSGRTLSMLTLQLADDSAALDSMLEQCGGLDGPDDESAKAPGIRRIAPGIRHIEPVRRRPPALLLLGLGALVGVIGMITVALLNPPRSVPSAAPAVSPVAAPNLLSIFAEPATFPSGFAGALGDDYRPESIRSIPNPAAGRSGYATYVAQHSDGQYCLILLHPDLTTDTACANQNTIAKIGLRLDAVVVPIVPGSRYPQRFAPIEATVYWDPAGVFNVAFTPLLPKQSSGPVEPP